MNLEVDLPIDADEASEMRQAALAPLTAEELDILSEISVLAETGFTDDDIRIMVGEDRYALAVTAISDVEFRLKMLQAEWKAKRRRLYAPGIEAQEVQEPEGAEDDTGKD